MQDTLADYKFSDLVCALVNAGAIVSFQRLSKTENLGLASAGPVKASGAVNGWLSNGPKIYKCKAAAAASLVGAHDLASH